MQMSPSPIRALPTRCRRTGHLPEPNALHGLTGSVMARSLLLQRPAVFQVVAMRSDGKLRAMHCPGSNIILTRSDRRAEAFVRLSSELTCEERLRVCQALSNGMEGVDTAVDLTAFQRRFGASSWPLPGLLLGVAMAPEQHLAKSCQRLFEIIDRYCS